MSDQVTEFSLVQKSFSLNQDVMTVVLEILSTTEEKAGLAIVATLDQATFTKGGTLVPTSQHFDVVKQEVSFSIPVILPHDKTLNYRFLGNVNVSGFSVNYETTVTVDPISTTVVELYQEENELFFTLVMERTDDKTPVNVPNTISVQTYSNAPETFTPTLVAAEPLKGKYSYKLPMVNVQEEPSTRFVKGSVSLQFSGYNQIVKYERTDRLSKPWNLYPEPLVDYAVKNMWGNRELDSQYHLKLARITPPLGHINDFFFMGKLFRLPEEEKFFVVYSMGGLDPNFWNMFESRQTWDPFNTWVKLSTISNDRGVALDLYNGKGYIFPRSNAYALNAYEGVTLIAIPITSVYPLPHDKNMYLRCYTTDINTAIISQAEQVKWRFGFSYTEFNGPTDLIKVKTQYNVFKSFNMGHVLFFVNGIVSDIDKYIGKLGDMLEVYYDPTIKQRIVYDYKSLNDFYSVLDSKRKLLLFPGLLTKPRKYHYFDDCDFYIVNKKTKQGFYFNRNNADAIRQLTHQDLSITSQYVEFLVSQLIALDTTGLSTENDMSIEVLYRSTKWEFNLGPNVSRINDLYLLEDPNQILAAMIGPNATVLEWSAPELEKSTTNAVLNSIIQQIDTKAVRNALGYNGCATALSKSVVCMPYVTPGSPGHTDVIKHEPFESGLGYRIPASYVENSTAYEYDINGLYLRKTPIINREWFIPGENGYYVEFVVGQALKSIDYVISRQDVLLKTGYGFRVYKAGWVIDPDQPDPEPVGLFENEYEITGNGEPLYPDPTVVPIFSSSDYENPNYVYGNSGGHPDGKWEDITDTNQYYIENGYLVWNFNLTNQVGMVVFDSNHLYNEFELTHMDKSIWFTISNDFTVGGLPLTIEPAQIDVWINNHPVSENIDYVIDFPRVYVISKMWLNENEINQIAYRGRGLSAKGMIPSSELGFVQNGVIGYNGRYNLRIDRPTKTITAGRLFMTDTIDWAETINHGNNMAPYNGFPYEVKHIYCANRYVDEHDLYWGFESARELDKRVSSYLTEFVKYKPVVPVVPPFLEQDRYRMFSPFMSQIVNEILLGFIEVPEPNDSEIGYSDQMVDNLTRNYQWLLKFDPIILGMDDRFFAFHAYSNMTKPVVTPNQLTMLSRINDLYLKGKLSIVSSFEVNSNV